MVRWRLRSSGMELTVRPATSADRAWLREFIRAHWGSEEMVDQARIKHPAENPAFIAPESPVG
jgi:hypothetical protein